MALMMENWYAAQAIEMTEQVMMKEEASTIFQLSECMKGGIPED
jgi:hypothetical protein